MSNQKTFNSMNNSENKTIEELRAYNTTLEQSSEYKRILPEVMKEVYTLFVKERIVSLERLAETEGLFGYDSYFPNDDLPWVLKTDDIHPPKTGISVHFSCSLP